MSCCVEDEFLRHVTAGLSFIPFPHIKISDCDTEADITSGFLMSHTVNVTDSISQFIPVRKCFIWSEMPFPAFW